MTCAELTRLLADHFAGTLPPEIAGALEAHAETCPCCRSLVRTYGITIGLAASLADVEVPSDVSARVTAVIRAQATYREGR